MSRFSELHEACANAGTTDARIISRLVGYEVRADELNKFAHLIAAKPSILVEPEPVGGKSPPEAEPPGYPGGAVEQAEPPTGTHEPVEQAELALAQATSALNEARQRVADAGLALRARRATLAEALTKWSAGACPPSREQLVREVSEQQRRDKLAAKQLPAPRLNSAVDRTAFYSQGARRGGRQGGGDAFRRGGITTRGLRLPRLPSER